MNFTLLGLFLVTLLTIQVKGVPSGRTLIQPIDLKENPTLLYDKLSSETLEKVNIKYLTLWAQTDYLRESGEKMLTSGLLLVQNTIDGFLKKIENLKDSALNLGVDFNKCQKESDAAMKKRFDDIKLDMDQCVWTSYFYGGGSVNNQLAELNNIITDVSDLGKKLDTCKTKKCYTDIEKSIQDMLDLLDQRVNDTAVTANVVTLYWAGAMNQCPIDSSSAVDQYGNSIIKSITDCINK